MDTHWFDDVLVLLEEGNMTRAAARRNITQPAFSRRIRSFEDWLGVAVLDRKTNRIEISPALAANEAEIRALAARLRELRTKIAHFDPSGAQVTMAAQHAAVISAFPALAARARAALPGLSIRLRTGNLGDCISMLVRGDAGILLCFEARSGGQMPFGSGVERIRWGTDRLIPVAGGALSDDLAASPHVPEDTPAIVYPEGSSFGDVLRQGACRFGTLEHAANPLCQTAFSSGIKEMVLQGLGIGWLPHSMVRRDLKAGTLYSLADELGEAPLDVVVYANASTEIASILMTVWSGPREAPSRQ